MCFSATASLIAGTALSTAGVVTIKKVKRRSALPFATIPLLFGIQQIIEGVIWLSFRYDARSLNSVMTYLYALFAFSLWPIFVPFAVGQLETEAWRKRTIRLFQLMGILVGLYLLYSHTRQPVVSHVRNSSISYDNSHFFGAWVLLSYFLATIGSCLVSSKRIVNAFGILTFLFAVVAAVVYTENFVSVWCFFAAILSLMVLLSLRDQKTPTSMNAAA